VSHANAALTPTARLRLARLVVDDGWPVARAAERFQVSWPTADRWARRYRELGHLGRDAMRDRSCRPHRQPTRTPLPVVRRIVHLQWKQRLGPVAIGAQVGLSPSTVHAVLTRCRINRLSHLDRVTGEPVRRYEHSSGPGSKPAGPSTTSSSPSKPPHHRPATPLLHHHHHRTRRRPLPHRLLAACATRRPSAGSQAGEPTRRPAHRNGQDGSAPVADHGPTKG